MLNGAPGLEGWQQRPRQIPRPAAYCVAPHVVQQFLARSFGSVSLGEHYPMAMARLWVMAGSPIAAAGGVIILALEPHVVMLREHSRLQLPILGTL